MGMCCYPTARAIHLNGSSVNFSNQVQYDSGASPRLVAFGESGQSGTWAGASNNGQANMVIFDSSWGAQPNYGFFDLSGMMAGVRLIGVCMPTTGDTAIVADRGAALAQQQLNNNSGAPFSAWGDAMNNLNSGDGGGYSGSAGSCGSGYGFNGCGCNYMMATANNQTNAEAVTNEAWYNLPADAYDATGNGYYYWTKTCNYDLSTYPANLP